jgi:hypothetical protein
MVEAQPAAAARERLVDNLPQATPVAMATGRVWVT